MTRLIKIEGYHMATNALVKLDDVAKKQCADLVGQLHAG